MNFTKWMKVVSLSVIALLVLGCSAEKTWLKPSKNAVGVPTDPNLPFQEYILASRKKITDVLNKQRFNNGKSPYVGGYSIQDVVDMRAPFQQPKNTSDLCTDKRQGAGKGFLLIHGLTDSPYLLRNMSDSLRSIYPCALTRAVLLPGHGTVVGDTLAMKYQDWMRITEYGVNSFHREERVDELYLVGFSTGTALSIKHLKKGSNTEKIKGLVLLSTAVKASSDLAWLTNYVKVFKDWLGTKKERDAARYSSFSVNSGAQFYNLTKDIMDNKYSVDIPVFMALSADDATINPQAAREFFCKNVNNKRKVMLWFKGFTATSSQNCEGIIEIDRPEQSQSYQNVDYNYANLAHTGVSVSPDDKHYGVQGIYKDCKFYESEDDKLWNACMADKGVKIFAEKNVQDMPAVLGEKGMWRRGTFNKDYQRVVQSIACFTNDACQLNTIN